MRIMGLDYGSRTVGVAISDDLLMTAQPKETIVRTSENKLRKTYARIEELIKEYDVQKIIVGLPLMTDGSEGERAKLSRDFADTLNFQDLSMTIAFEMIHSLKGTIHIRNDNGKKFSLYISFKPVKCHLLHK